jgi:hypothetical protein
VPLIEHQPVVHVDPNAIVGSSAELVHAPFEGDVAGPASRELVFGKAHRDRVIVPVELNPPVVA